MKIVHIVADRPNYMKLAPIIREMSLSPERFDQLLVHTGQHYDNSMSGVFFSDLGIQPPAINLEVGSGSHAWQTAQIMMRIEPILIEHRPDFVFVPGDVNSTAACTLVASKLGLTVAHVESGLRSWDRSMPEEINRVITDHIADVLLTPSRDADENLKREGISPEKIFFVGNVMIDTLIRLLPKAEERWPDLRERFPCKDDYCLVTLHRPSNVDDPAKLAELLALLGEISSRIPVLFPVHPRTKARINTPLAGRLHLLEPLGYLDFLALQKHSRLVITDSGGIQEETSFLGIPCLTVRENTERPITIECGTNRLIRDVRQELLPAVDQVMARPMVAAKIERWDGKAAERIVSVINQLRH